jgi:hypothetical protein
MNAATDGESKPPAGGSSQVAARSVSSPARTGDGPWGCGHSRRVWDEPGLTQPGRLAGEPGIPGRGAQPAASRSSRPRMPFRVERSSHGQWRSDKSSSGPNKTVLEPITPAPMPKAVATTRAALISDRVAASAATRVWPNRGGMPSSDHHFVAVRHAGERPRGHYPRVIPPGMAKGLSR